MVYVKNIFLLLIFLLLIFAILVNFGFTLLYNDSDSEISVSINGYNGKYDLANIFNKYYIGFSSDEGSFLIKCVEEQKEFKRGYVTFGTINYYRFQGCE